MSNITSKQIKQLAQSTLSSLVLVGCATLSESECKNANWELIGYSDASAGYLTNRVKDHSSACAKTGVSVNLNQYLAGYDRGLPSYCTASNAYHIGETGASFPAQCDTLAYPAMIKAHQVGKQANLIIQERRLIDEQINQKRKQIEALQRSIQMQNEQLLAATQDQAKHRHISREIDSLEAVLADLYVDERNLRSKSQELANRRSELANAY